MPRKIYVASSWRNPYQPDIVKWLREEGHEVYDFRNPAPGDNGFHWSEIDPRWESWTQEEYANALRHPISNSGFAADFNAMGWADTCVLVLPSGRSAHIEAGQMIGAGKQTFILILDPCEPELMYKMASGICLSIDELIERLRE